MSGGRKKRVLISITMLNLHCIIVQKHTLQTVVNLTPLIILMLKENVPQIETLHISLMLLQFSHDSISQHSLSSLAIPFTQNLVVLTTWQHSPVTCALVQPIYSKSDQRIIRSRKKRVVSCTVNPTIHGTSFRGLNTARTLAHFSLTFGFQCLLVCNGPKGLNLT